LCFKEDDYVELICNNPNLAAKGFIEVFTVYYKKYKVNIKEIEKLIMVLQDLAFNFEEGYKKPSLELLRVLCKDNKTYIKPSLAKFYELIKYLNGINLESKNGEQMQQRIGIYL